MRTQASEREVGFVLVRDEARVRGVEVTLSQTVEDKDVRHLLWLREQLGADLVDAVAATGQTAYRRSDGIAVVPAALLGP